MTALSQTVHQIVENTPVFDIHTHLFPPAFNDLVSWGIDELLTYHYLIAEVFRCGDVDPTRFWNASRAEQANLIWQKLFLDRSPVSEACRGVISSLQIAGIDPAERDLNRIRKRFNEWTPDAFTDMILEKAKVRRVGMTNLPFDDAERAHWDKNSPIHPAFTPALRIDPLLLDWENTAPKLASWGYQVATDLSGKTLDEIKRFLSDWAKRIHSAYTMVSLPPDWRFPANTTTNRILTEAVLPYCSDNGQAFAMMIGVRRNVNPTLKMAGDSLDAADVISVENICNAFPKNRFICTMLARENQHALCIAARKFANLHIFGCWWFLNNPSLIEEITRMRIELLGLNVTPQHSDCRVMDQLGYKWAHSRPILAKVLSEKYEDLARSGWIPSTHDIQRDVNALLGGSFEAFLASA